MQKCFLNPIDSIAINLKFKFLANSNIEQCDKTLKMCKQSISRKIRTRHTVSVHTDHMQALSRQN